MRWKCLICFCSFFALGIYCENETAFNRSNDTILGVWKKLGPDVHSFDDSLTIVQTDTSINFVFGSEEEGVCQVYFFKKFDGNYYCDPFLRYSFYVACKNDTLTMYEGKIYYSLSGTKIIGSTWVNPFMADTFSMSSDSIHYANGFEQVYHSTDSILINRWFVGSEYETTKAFKILNYGNSLCINAIWSKSNRSNTETSLITRYIRE